MGPFVERLQVEEGFLADMDLTFQPGLNVLIGPRGVGKTSIIELIRFCLGVKGRTEEADERSRRHALSILGSGRVTVTLRDGDRETLVSRTAGDDLPRRSAAFRPPMIFSQAEIEQVGLEARGRLSIIDGLAPADAEESRHEAGLTATIRSLTVELRQLSRDMEGTDEQIALLGDVANELEVAIQLQRSALKTVKESAKQEERLDALNESLTSATVRSKHIEQARQDIDGWRTRVRTVLGRPPRIGAWPSSAGLDDLLEPVRSALRKLTLVFDEGLKELDKLVDLLGQKQTSSQSHTLELEDKARTLRRELEALRAGAGTAAQRVSALQEKSGHLEALRSRLTELRRRIAEVQEHRGTVLAQLQSARDKRYDFRNDVAETLTEELGPTVDVSVEQGGDAPAYVAAIQTALRGSGLHHKALGPQLAQGMSPRELAEAVENGDALAISQLAGISEERANKVVLAIRASGPEDIITAPIHDRVVMSLLVGQEYKSTTQLSTGQRCTVILSVLMGYQQRGLIIDQPEDNLDNAFVVTTLVEAIRRRKSQTQLILTTHNANIPVLGDADSVVLLGSDGRRGFVRIVGQLTDREIVRAITTVMEGGHEAFERRATFYRKWLG